MAKLLPTTVIIAAFTDEDLADTVSTTLAAAVVDKQIPPFANMAATRKDASGKVKVSEMGNSLAFTYGTVGALVGGLSCLLLGPAAIAAGAAVGAAIGAGGTKALVEGSIDKTKVKDLAKAMPPSSSGLIVVFHELPIDKSVWNMVEVQQARDELLYKLARDIGDTLRSGQNCAYMYALTEEGVVATRMAVGDQAADIQGLVATAEGVAGAKATTVGGDTIVYEAAGTDGIEAAYAAGVITEDGKATLTETVAAIEE